MSVKHLYLMAAGAIIGCAPASGTSTQGPAAPRKANLLTAAEIVSTGADVGTAYDAIARLRPIWLTSRGAVSFNTPGTEFPVVFVDGQKYGELNSLRNIPAYQVTEARFYTSAESGGIFGLLGGTAGVIEVKMGLKR
jgi:hypothetical protein